MIITGSLRGNFYYLNTIRSPKDSYSAFVTSLDVWNARFSHIHADGLMKLASNNIIRGLDKVSSNTRLDFQSCVYVKQTRTPIPKGKCGRAQNLLYLVHSDVGTMPTESLGKST